MHPGAGDDSAWFEQPPGEDHKAIAHPTWYPRWCTKDLIQNQAGKNCTLPVSSIDFLNERELAVLRKLHSTEVVDYSTDFYQNDYFDSISAIYTCDQCNKDFFELVNLRKHVATKHFQNRIGQQTTADTTASQTPAKTVISL